MQIFSNGRQLDPKVQYLLKQNGISIGDLIKNQATNELYSTENWGTQVKGWEDEDKLKKDKAV